MTTIELLEQFSIPQWFVENSEDSISKFMKMKKTKIVNIHFYNDEYIPKLILQNTLLQITPNDLEIYLDLDGDGIIKFEQKDVEIILVSEECDIINNWKLFCHQQNIQFNIDDIVIFQG